MSQQLKIAIIDDDRMSAHNWNILMRFIGEEPVMLAGDNWQQRLTNKDTEINVFVILVGTLMESHFNDNATQELILKIHEWNQDVYILTKIDEKAIEELPEQNRKTILSLPEQSDYQSLLKSLNLARKSHGLSSPELPSSLISDTGTAMFRSLVGESDLMQGTRELMHKVADTKANVLVLGESGTGKEIMARNLHYHSGRGNEPFVIVNCAILTDDLFGQEAGFNGNSEVRPGLLEKANSGTLFLDEVSDMSLDVQAKIMRFFEQQCFERQGGSETIYTDARIVAATNKNLKELIDKGLFREDLYFRLSVVPITVPPLREHTEDIPELINELIARLENQSSNSIRFNSSALNSLQQHPWVGNVRELANLVERLSIIQSNEVIGVGDLPLEYQHRGAPLLETVAISGEEETAAVLNPIAEENTQSSEKKKAEPVEAGVESDIESGIGGGIDGAIESGIPSNSQLASPKALQALTEENLKAYLNNLEKHLIEVAIEDSAGMLTFTADRLNLDEELLQEKMKQHEIA